MDYIIMCGGSYSYMSKPKAMFEINGEKLIERTIRLLNENGISNKNIIISSNYEAFDNFGVKRISNEKNNWQWVNKKSIGYWLDAFLPYDKKCTYLYGDVYYSEAAIKTIIEKANIVTENTLAGSAIAKNTLGKNWGEPFAFIVPKPLTFHAGIKAVKKIQDEGGLTRGYAITWELYRFLNGLDINIQAVKDETFFVIDDETIDIDTEEELQKLLNKIK